MRRILQPVQDSLAGAVSLPSSSTTEKKQSSKMKGGHASASSRTNKGVGGGGGGGRTSAVSGATPTRGGVLAAAASVMASIPDGASADSLQNLAVGRRAANKSKSGAMMGADTLALATGGDGDGGPGGLSIRDSDKLRPGGVNGKRQSRRRGNKKKEEQKVTRRDTNVENAAPGPAPGPVQFHSTCQPTAATFTSLMAEEVANSTTDAGGAQESGTASIPSAGSSNKGNAGEQKPKKRTRRGVRGGRRRSARTRQSGGGGALGALGMAMPAAIGDGGDGGSSNKDKAIKNEKKKKGNSKRNIGGTLAAEPRPPTSTVLPATTQPNVLAEEIPASSVLATLDLSMMSLDRSQEGVEGPNKSKGVEENNDGGGILGQTVVAAKKVSPSPAIPATVEHANSEIVDTGAGSLPSGEGSESQPMNDGNEAMDIDAADSLAMEVAQKSAEPRDQGILPPPLPCPEVAMMKSPVSSKKTLKSKRQRKQSFSPPAVQIRKVFSAAAAKASAVAPSSTFANWGSPSPRPKPSKRVDKKKTPVVVSKLDDEFMAEESPRAADGPSPNGSVPMSPIVKAPAPINSPVVEAKKSVERAPVANKNAGGNKIGGSKVLAVSPAEYNSSQFEANAIATRLFEDIKDTAIRNVLTRSNTNTKVSGYVSETANESAKGSTKDGSGSMVIDVQAAGSPKMIHVAGNVEFDCVEDSRPSTNDENTSISKVQKNVKAKKVAGKSKSKKKNQGKKESKQDSNGSEGPIAAAVATVTAAGSSMNQRPRRQAKKVNRLSVSWNDTTYQEKSNKALYDECSDGGEDGDDAFAEYEQMCRTQKEKVKKKQTNPSPLPSKEKSKRRGSLKKGIKSVATKGRDKQNSFAKAKASESRKANSTSDDQLSPGSTWSSEQVQALRKAYHAVEPTSFCFWEDVASGLDSGKTAEQCRDKWFSLVQTPKVRAKKKVGRNGQRSGRKTPAALRKDVDDLFQSTPYRRVNVNIDEDGDDSGNSCDESEGFIGDDDVMLPCEFGSPISHSPSKMVNQAAAEADEDGDRDNTRDISPIHFRTGYKGYIKGLAKIRRRNGGKRRGGGGGANATLTPAIKDKSGRNVSAKIGAGDVQMNGVLTPGGTIQVRAPTDSDLEDLVIRPGEEYSDDEESFAKENAELEV